MPLLQPSLTRAGAVTTGNSLVGYDIYALQGSGGGPTGPTGPAGPTGSTGPTGPASVGGMSLVFWADQTNTNGNGVLAVVDQYSNVIVNNGITISNNGTSNAALVLSESGTYRFDVAGWVCGSGNGTNRVVATRTGSGVVYDRSRGWGEIACGVGSQQFLWDGFLSNDVIQIYKNQNNAGTLTTSISNSATVDEWGPISIYKVG